MRQRARDWRGLVRSVTEHRSEAEPRKARPPAAHEALLPYRHAAAAAGGRAQIKNNKFTLNYSYWLQLWDWCSMAELIKRIFAEKNKENGTLELIR